MFLIYIYVFNYNQFSPTSSYNDYRFYVVKPLLSPMAGNDNVSKTLSSNISLIVLLIPPILDIFIFTLSFGNILLISSYSLNINL